MCGSCNAIAEVLMAFTNMYTAFKMCSLDENSMLILEVEQ